ncbi:hypothetical protein MELE44368_05385 [Mycolicibacterium elephantis DSM 44368]|uniref:Uncharacterized protein n=1 Tax=Mycolicibacterium elephantis DSM 44368 TaxID=1335622 RepID=A0A439DPS7_9MYCO|nr:hypothetical protein MELE44368_05385 [Mycolicibacterium elephantis DSM 44368]
MKVVEVQRVEPLVCCSIQERLQVFLTQLQCAPTPVAPSVIPISQQVAFYLPACWPCDWFITLELLLPMRVGRHPLAGCGKGSQQPEPVEEIGSAILYSVGANELDGLDTHR